MSWPIVLAALASIAQLNPFASYRKLTSSNGFAPVVYDADARRVNSFRENLYRYPAPGLQTRELAYDAYLGLRVNGTSAWLTGTPLDEVAYELGTNLIRTVQTFNGVRATTTYFAPFGLGARAFLVVAQIENVGSDTTDVALFSILNFHTGGGANQIASEHITWNASLGAYLESSSLADAPHGVLVAKPLTPSTHHTATPMNPYPLVMMSQLFGDVDDSGVIDDAVSGFEFDALGRGAFPHGATFEIALAIGWAPDQDAAALSHAIDTFARGRTPSQILADERRAWSDWRAGGVLPRGTSATEDRVVEQALAVLRMGQVREPGAPNGAIVASIAPGYWDIAWLRDAMLAAEALERTGHAAEAEAALEFAIRGPVGMYQSYVGRPYGLSVARYFGNGAEDSDSNANGPNIELDGFGMYLGVAALHAMSSTNGAAWFARRRGVIDPLVADVLMGDRDPETQLVAADSSIWETHWDNGGRQRWSYTSGMAAYGLAAWSGAIAALAGAQDPGALRYQNGTSALRSAILASLIDPATHALAASVEQLRAGDGNFVDAQAAMVINAGVVSATSAIGLGTLDLLKQRLFLGATGHGYKRNDDGGAYDNHEWIVVDLAIARALRSAGRVAEADSILGWVTAEADLNFDLLPENLSETDATYTGSIPMVGFGSGAYLLALLARGADGGSPIDGGATSDASLADGEASDAGAASNADALSSADALFALDAASGGDAGGGDASSGNGDSGSSGGPRVMQSSCGCHHTDRDASPYSSLIVLLTLVGALNLVRARSVRVALADRR